MELQAQLPADILALAAPAGRAPPDSSPASGEAGAAAPFDALMLTLAATAAPSGDVLPESGNARRRVHWRQ